MAEYTPSTSDIRYWLTGPDYEGGPVAEVVGRDFDRWLAAHDRAVKADVWDQAVAWHAGHVQQIKAWRATGGHYTPDHEDDYNPYRADEMEAGA